MRKLPLALLALLCAAPLFAQTAQPAAPEKWLGFAGPDTYLTASDGWKVASSYLSPVSSRPVVMLMHSIGRDKQDWAPLAAEFKRYGVGYIALDLRGHGGSCLDISGSTTSWKNFRRSGTDNEFNQMTRDMEAALSFLAAHGVDESRVVLIGSGLGANLAVKVAALHPQIPMAALLAPTLNATRDVLAVNPMRVYGKRPLMMVVSVDDKRLMNEAHILRSIATQSVGAGNLVFVTEPKGPSWKLLTKTVIADIMQWLKTPVLPDEAPVAVSTAAASVDVSTAPLHSDTTATEQENDLL